MLGRREFLQSLASAPFVFSARASDDPSSAITPYLQRVDETQAAVLWNTVESGPGRVEWSTNGRQWASVATTAQEFRSADTGLGYNFYRHTAELQELPAGVTVQYRVRFKDVTRPDGFFRTSQASRTIDSFLAFGDSGTASVQQMALMQRMSSEDPSLVLHTGDLAYPVASYEALEAKYLRPYANLMSRAPFFPCPGNHDYGYETARAYLETHSLPADPQIQSSHCGRYYSFRWGPVRFISLDSNDPLWEEEGSNRMLAWLRMELARNRSFWQVAFFHHPPYTAGKHAADESCRLAGERISPLLEEAGVPLILNGHDHLYTRTVPVRKGRPATGGGGSVYVTTGGGGADIYPYTPHELSAAGESAHHFMRFRLDGYRLVGDAMNAAGVSLDRFLIEPSPQIEKGNAVNSASFRPGVAAGGLATIFGSRFALKEERATVLPVPPSAGLLTVQLDDRPVPVLFASPTQLNIQIPFDMQGERTLRITTPNGRAEAPLMILAVAPAIFRVRVDRVNVPAVFATHSGLPVTADRPARAGQTFSLFATGLGGVNSAMEAGEAPLTADGPRVAGRVRVLLGNAEVEPQYAGLAEGLPGVYRVTFQLPASLPAGELELRLSIRDTYSEPERLPVV